MTVIRRNPGTTCIVCGVETRRFKRGKWHLLYCGKNHCVAVEMRPVELIGQQRTRAISEFMTWYREQPRSDAATHFAQCIGDLRPR